VSFVFSLKLLLLLLAAETMIGSSFLVSFSSLFVMFSLAAIGLEIYLVALMLLLDRRSPRWKIDFQE
jgi:heme/copper-type cytochrome/quinol oxidase subunit 4